MSSFLKKLGSFFLQPLSSFLQVVQTTLLRISDNPEVIYNTVTEFIDKGRYLEAGELINEIRTRFPQSRFAALSGTQTSRHALCARPLYGGCGRLWRVRRSLPHPTKRALRSLSKSIVVL